MSEAREAPRTDARKDWRARRDLGFDVSPGVFIDGHGAGASLGGAVLHRRGLLVLGIMGNVGKDVLSTYSYWAGSAALGVSAPSPSWLRVDLLGGGGVHSYAHVGALPFPAAAALLGFSSDSGSSAVLPFASARLRTSIEVGRSKRFAIGLEAAAETDLARAQRSYDTTALGLGYREGSRATRTVGTERLLGALTFGGTFDL